MTAVGGSETAAALRDVRRRAKRADEALAALEASILAARSSGAPVRGIADSAGCSHPTVMNILAGLGWARPVGRSGTVKGAGQPPRTR